MSTIRNATVIIAIAGAGSDGNAIDIDADYVITNEADRGDAPDIEPRHLTTWIQSRGRVDITWMLQLGNVREDIAYQISEQLENEAEQERLDRGKRGKAA